MDQWMQNLFAAVREGQPGDITGSRGALDVAVSERLINEIVSARIPPGGAVREVTIHPHPGRARVTVRLARPAFLPPLTLGVTIERQANLPESPELVLKLEMPAGLGLLVGLGANLFASLPAGIRIEGELVRVDLRTVLASQDLGWALRYAESIVVTFEAGRVRITGSAVLE
jgi:hypothetical protein